MWKVNFPVKKHRIKDMGTAFWNFLTSKTGAFIIGVSAIAIGSYQFYINKPIMEYATDTVNFISSSNDNDYKITVKDQEYSDLYMTRVTLSNNGAMALSGRDVSRIGHDPIRIVIPQDAGVVHYQVDNQLTSEAITPELQKVNGDLVMDFDFINPDNQMVVTLLHQKPDADFVIKGSALNVNSIHKQWNEKQLHRLGWVVLGSLYIVLLLVYIYRHTRSRFFNK